MKKPPHVETIAKWVKTNKPLGISDPVTVVDIDPKPWSGHFNYLITGGDKRFILRFRGPEWGESNGVRKEYEILRAVESFDVGPEVFGFTKDFLGEDALFMEYLDGLPLIQLSHKEQRARFKEVARLIARINSIPAVPDVFPVSLKPYYDSYTRSIVSWNRRLDVIKKHPPLATWARRLQEIQPRAEALIHRFEPRLRRVLDSYGSVFIFASAHAGHCFVTKQGLQFINWEDSTLGDPSFSLAVFLTSLLGREDFKAVREEMLTKYSQTRSVPEFEELFEQRMAERVVSNLFWVLWAYAERGDTRNPDEATSAEVWYQRALKCMS